MIAVFFRSIGLHLLWFVQSLTPGKHPAAPLGWARLFFLLLGFPLFVSVQFVHWLGFLLDELFFRGYRQVQIREPVFISGIPRSGTTFVHRTLAIDTAQFTSVSTWEAALAPSVTERKCIRLIARIDSLIGGPGAKFIHWLTAKATGDFNAVHAVDPCAPEEDYLWLLPAGACFILLMAFPFSIRLRQTAQLDQMPSHTREQILSFYLSCIQRHLYCAPSGCRFLSKNAAFASWIKPLAARLPDARFLLCLRDPQKGLSSQLSSLKSARMLFATDPDGTTTTATFTKIFAGNLEELASLENTEFRERVAFIEQEDLRRDSRKLLTAALELVGIQPSPALTQYLNELTPTPESGHRYDSQEFKLENHVIDDCLNPPYQLILSSTRRARSIRS